MTAFFFIGDIPLFLFAFLTTWCLESQQNSRSEGRYFSLKKKTCAETQTTSYDKPNQLYHRFCHHWGSVPMISGICSALSLPLRIFKHRGDNFLVTKTLYVAQNYMRTCNVYQKTNLRPANELFREAKLVEEKLWQFWRDNRYCPI